MDSAQQKLLRSTKFPPTFNQQVDIRKVETGILKKWITEKITQILERDDELVIDYACELIDDKHNFFPNIKELQIKLTGFLDKEAPAFCKELWDLMLSAQDSPQGVPTQLLEQKKQEIMKQKPPMLQRLSNSAASNSNETREHKIETIADSQTSDVIAAELDLEAQIDATTLEPDLVVQTDATALELDLAAKIDAPILESDLVVQLDATILERDRVLELRCVGRRTQSADMSRMIDLTDMIDVAKDVTPRTAIIVAAGESVALVLAGGQQFHAHDLRSVRTEPDVTTENIPGKTEAETQATAKTHHTAANAEPDVASTTDKFAVRAEPNAKADQIAVNTEPDVKTEGFVGQTEPDAEAAAQIAPELGNTFHSEFKPTSPRCEKKAVESTIQVG